MSGRSSRPSKDIAPNFGLVLDSFLVKKGLSRTKLSELSGVHQSAISRIIRGERLPNYDTCMRFSKAIGLNSYDSAFLLGSAGYLSPLLTRVISDPFYTAIIKVTQDTRIPLEKRTAFVNETSRKLSQLAGERD